MKYTVANPIEEYWLIRLETESGAWIDEIDKRLHDRISVGRFPACHVSETSQAIAVMHRLEDNAEISQPGGRLALQADALPA
ncbi:MAG: hypothetical protein KDJ87_20795, partial [Rhizobiaceae bacterium]|nr:hypothetical protein [Rhizobiaceae bacterium]